MAKPEKEKIVSELASKINNAKSLLLTDYKGLNVEEISDLRSKFRESSVEYHIVKNTLVKLSLEQLGIKQLVEFLEGPTAIAFGSDDPIAPAKVVTSFLKDKEKPTMKAYYLDGEVYKGKEIDEISKLPSQEVLLTQLVGTINAPLTGLVSVLNNFLQQLVVVLNEIKNQKE
jgi:large subunit ribosomal protein L10